MEKKLNIMLDEQMNLTSDTKATLLYQIREELKELNSQLKKNNAPRKER